jgi:hypothetical protein
MRCFPGERHNPTSILFRSRPASQATIAERGSLKAGSSETNAETTKWLLAFTNQIAAFSGIPGNSSDDFDPNHGLFRAR